MEPIRINPDEFKLENFINYYKNTLIMYQEFV